MLKVGITGGVACGKSTVGQMFVAHGAYLIRSDEIGHHLMEPGQKVYDEVVKTFGRGILNEDGTVNRPRLADAVFPTGRIAELNAIIHPAVITAHDLWMNEIFERDAKAVAMVEAALMLESGSWKHFDRMITVTCSMEQKVERFAARNRLSLDAARAEVERRMKAQAPDEEKIMVSQYVIDNSGSLDRTRRQVDKVWRELKALASPN